MVTAAMLGVPNVAVAQSFTWGGSGSATSTDEYTLGSNWSNAPTGAPPVSTGQSAIFDNAGSGTVVVSSDPVAPDSWTFTAGAQAYSISGAAVNFSVAGPGGGVIDNAASGQTITIANNIGESTAGVQVQLLGTSVLVLSGSNSYSGGTTVVNGVLQVTNDNSVGTGTVTLSFSEFQANSASDLTFANNFSIAATVSNSAIDANGVALTLNGNITGPGGLTVLDSSSGRGMVVFNGAGSYTGGTAICGCATLQLGDATHTASLVGAITNEGTFNVVNADFSGVTSLDNLGVVTFNNRTNAGSAVITNESGAQLGFLGQSSAGHATIDNEFIAVFQDSSSAGSATISNNSELVFTDRASAGNATIVNAGFLAFGNNATAGNANIINTGDVVFGEPGGSDTATVGNAVITSNSGGELVFGAFATAGNAKIITNDGSLTQFFDNSTGGNAQFITNGTGIVDFGETRGPNGDGRVTAGSIAGSGTYYIGVGNTLVVGGNDLSTVVSGVIADSCGCSPGSGSLEKVGAGTLTLSGPNTYTGATTINGGFLDVEGSIASSFRTTVDLGGALTGAGIVGDTRVASGGIFMPGNGVGTAMTVKGDLAFLSGALYLVQVNSTSASSANVTGRATLAGNVGVAVIPGSQVQRQYTILTANGGVSGGFDGVSGAPGALVASLSYDPTHVFLNFGLDYSRTGPLDANQQAVATALTNFFNANGGISPVYTALTPSGLTQASGELGTGSQQATFNAMDLFLKTLLDPFVAGRGGQAGSPGGATGYAEEGGADAYAVTRRGAAHDAYAMFTKAPPAASFDQRWSVWAAGFGGAQTTDGNAAVGSNQATSRIFGTAVGADYLLTPRTLAGFAVAGGGTNFAVANLGGGRSDLFQAGAYLRHNAGPAYLAGALAYGWQDVTTDRTVTAAGLDRLRAEFQANAFSGRIEGGYRFATPWMGVTPYAAGQFTTFDLPAYAERALAGSGAFALSYAAKSVTDSRSELGFRTDRSIALPDGVMTLRSRFAWAHDFNPDRTVAATFQALPGASFVVNGAAQASDSALTTAAIEMRWLNGWSAAVSFEGEFSNVTASYAGKGLVHYTW